MLSHTNRWNRHEMTTTLLTFSHFSPTSNPSPELPSSIWKTWPDSDHHSDSVAGKPPVWTSAMLSCSGSSTSRTPLPGSSTSPPLAPGQVPYKIQNPNSHLQVPPWPGPPVPVWPPPSPHPIPDSELHWLRPALHSPLPSPHLWGSGLRFCRTHPLELSPPDIRNAPSLDTYKTKTHLFNVAFNQCSPSSCPGYLVFCDHVLWKATLGPLKGAI